MSRAANKIAEADLGGVVATSLATSTPLVAQMPLDLKRRGPRGQEVELHLSGRMCLMISSSLIPVARNAWISPLTSKVKPYNAFESHRKLRTNDAQTVRRKLLRKA